VLHSTARPSIGKTTLAINNAAEMNVSLRTTSGTRGGTAGRPSLDSYRGCSSRRETVYRRHPPPEPAGSSRDVASGYGSIFAVDTRSAKGSESAEFTAHVVRKITIIGDNRCIQGKAIMPLRGRFGAFIHRPGVLWDPKIRADPHRSAHSVRALSQSLTAAARWEIALIA